MSSEPRLKPADLHQLSVLGIDSAEAERQMRHLAAPPTPARLLRPATLGDGVERIEADREAELLARARAAQDLGRFTKFVPASGAATRMFRAVTGSTSDVAAGDDEERQRTLSALPDLPIGHEILRLAGDTPLADWFRTPAGADFAALPKALLPFHADRGELRTAFDDQIAEGLGYLRDKGAKSRFHFTIAAPFGAAYARAVEPWRDREGPGLQVEFSEQRPSTGALALDESGEPARAADGRLLVRPSGHGALLENLATIGAAGADLVFVKNIDNILPSSRHAAIARTKLLLAGILLERDERRRDRSRPLRVAAVVANAGEPGGGPFWVERAGGTPALQIVESAEVDLGDTKQREIWRRSTHFNPVDLVVRLRDGGDPYDLARFVDPERAFVTEKSAGGRTLRVYERPGLWNGAMAGWETIFVELPAWTFAPVKTLLDLARPEHRSGAG